MARAHPSLLIGTFALLGVALWLVYGDAFTARATIRTRPRKTKTYFPSWYPYKQETGKHVPLPQGDVKITQQEAFDYFYKRLNRFTSSAMNDPDELPYVRDRVAEFIGYTYERGQATVQIANVYNPSMPGAAMQTTPSGRSGLATLAVFVPFWMEYDREYAESYVRDRFLSAVVHEVDHVRAGLWRQSAERITRGVLVRDEASVWAKTCDDVETPFIESKREPPVFLSSPCIEYAAHGKNPDSPAFLSFIAQTKMN